MLAGSWSMPQRVLPHWLQHCMLAKRTVASDGTHNIPYIALGAGLLWFGWYGFNAGSELQVNTVTVSAFVTTDIAAAFAAVTWFYY
ncbi:ammonium transporter [Klebsiella pneumoniae]|uniref:Ammonium transporter n=1 Tax=Klebsiella pneumoniae TaxID=573 RepID=A0A3S4GYE2_KLEPN|nr:ammonium transporter [Klebsiella pneumoniae]